MTKNGIHQQKIITHIVEMLFPPVSFQAQGARLMLRIPVTSNNIPAQK